MTATEHLGHPIKSCHPQDILAAHLSVSVRDGMSHRGDLFDVSPVPIRCPTALNGLGTAGNGS